MMNEKHIGSDFDSFLEENGLLQEVDQAAVKRVLAFQIRELMKENNLTKTDMANRLQTSRAALNRLLDPENESVTLQTMNRAARVLGKQLHLSIS
jgi:DNA-binding Xre family transcriptional regulator